MRATRRPVLFVPGREADPPTRLPDYRNVLLATDLSPSTVEVGRRVLEFARGFGSRVEVVHVIDSRQVEEEEWAEVLERQVRDEVRNCLDGLEFQVHVLAGKPSHRIAAFAAESDCDLLFLGSSGRHALTDWFLGSTASRVIRLLPCPIFLVPAGRKGAIQEQGLVTK
jgi:universal stress protein A